MGREELNIIIPALCISDVLRDKSGGSATSRVDALFQPKYLKEADALLATYHDQDLPVLK
ncbi:MAG: 4-hydroxythreonine-4-phosphate dehydrogenase PdxA [Candidatus Malihini olakiniferum]